MENNFGDGPPMLRNVAKNEIDLGGDLEDVVEEEASEVQLTEAKMSAALEMPKKPDQIEVTTSEPYVGMSFQSGMDAYQFYSEYAKRVGFGVRKKMCRRSKTNNEMIAGWYVCTREGKSMVKENTTQGFRDPRRIACRAALKVKRVDDKEWKVIGFVEQHNHELGPETALLFRCHNKNHVVRRLSDLSTRQINGPIGRPFFSQKINRSRLRKRDAAVMSGEQPGVQDREREHCFDRGRRFFAPTEAQAIHTLFMRMYSKNPAFFYAVECDAEQHLKSVFWMDAKSKAACTHFGDVVTLDTSYLTQGYKVPFVCFVGVNHHGQSILLGCGLLADESTSSFVWLFKTWLNTISGRPPKAIITDYNKDVASAVMQVFPTTHHRFCLWHIIERVPKKLGDVCEGHENFLRKFHKCIYDSTADAEFEKRWWKLIRRFGLGNEHWLHMLYNDRRQWIPLYLRDIFFAGMSTSKRGKSVSCIFDKYISQDTSLKEFLDKYELALEMKYEDEAREEILSFHSKPKERTYPNPFELQLANIYTRNMFNKFQAEVLGISSVFASKTEEEGNITTYKVKAYEVQEDKNNRKFKEKEYKVVWSIAERKIRCVCRLFEFEGYLCRHALSVFLALGVLEIPSHYILQRWTKDAKRRHILDEGYSVHGDCSESVAQCFNDLCSHSLKFADEASLSKRSYDVALLALQEVFRKVSQVNSITRDNGQHCYSRNGNCYKASEETQSSNSGATHVLSEPQVPDTLETPKRSGVENGASWPNEERN